VALKSLHGNPQSCEQLCRISVVIDASNEKNVSILTFLVLDRHVTELPGPEGAFTFEYSWTRICGRIAQYDTRSKSLSLCLCASVAVPVCAGVSVLRCLFLCVWACLGACLCVPLAIRPDHSKECLRYQGYYGRRHYIVSEE
jgi:hypothetical protein